MSGRVAVLASGSGSNLQALLDHGDPIDVVGVIVDRAGAGALERAAAAGTDADTVDFAAYDDRSRWEQDLVAAISALRPDVVALAGFMRILGPASVGRWPTVNVHPSLLPAFPGARAVEQALAHGVKLSGATVHLVDEGVDTGPIIAQQAVAVHPDDDVASLHGRIQAVEHTLFPRSVRWLLEGAVHVDGRVVRTPADDAVARPPR